MIKLFPLFCFSLTLSSIAKSQDEVSLPRDVPPVVAMATAKASNNAQKGAYQIHLVIPSIRYELVEQELNAGRNTKVASWIDVVTQVKPISRILQFQNSSQIPDSKVVDVAGKPLDAQTTLQRLQEPTPVLISVSGKMVDPYYLPLIHKDAVIILLSRKDGKGDDVLMPNEQQGNSAEIPTVVELDNLPTTREVFAVANRLEPIQIKTKEAAEPYFPSAGLQQIDKEIHFDKQFLLIFAWRGSGQDKLTYAESDNSVEFRLTPGRTRDLRPHVHVYALTSNVAWKAVLAKPR